MIEALYAGEIDLAYIGPNPAVNGYVRSNGATLRIVAGATSGGASLVVHPAAGIGAPGDLAGKRLATPQYASTQDVAMRAYLAAQGLRTTDQGGDVMVLPTQNPEIITLFQKGELDGAWVPEPWATRLVVEAGGLRLIDERELWPGGRFVTTQLIASTRFLDAQPELLRAFLRGHLDTIAFIDADRDEAMRLVNQQLERVTTRPLPPEVLAEAMGRVAFTYDPLAATLLVSAERAHALGFLGYRELDLSQIYALEPLNAVLAERQLPPVPPP